MNKAYLISVSTAVALGYAAGFTADGLTAEASVPTQVEDSLKINLTQQKPTLANAFNSNIAADVCDYFDTKYGLSGPTACVAAEDVDRFIFSYNNAGDLIMVADVSFPATATIGGAQ